MLKKAPAQPAHAGHLVAVAQGQHGGEPHGCEPGACRTEGIDIGARRLLPVSSVTRQRSHDAEASAFLLRMTRKQHDELAAKAEEAGLTIRAYILRAVLTEPGDLPSRVGRPANGHVQEALLPESA